MRVRISGVDPSKSTFEEGWPKSFEGNLLRKNFPKDEFATPMDPKISKILSFEEMFDFGKLQTL